MDKPVQQSAKVRSGLLVSLGVIGGLWWFLRNLESSPCRAWGGLALVLQLALVSLARNAEWASDVLLYESSYRRGNQNGRTLQLLVGVHLGKKSYSRAVKICDRHAGRFKRKAKFSYRCGVAYSQVGRFDDAEQAFLLAINDPETEALIHQELAGIFRLVQFW